MITLKQLDHFRAVYELGSVHRAADTISISQPALTASIGKLEDQLGNRLFVRSSGGMEPTDFAKRVARQSYEILNRATDLQHEADLFGALETGSLRLGVQQGIRGAILGEFFPAFVARFPNLDYSIVERSSNELVATLMRDEIDLVVAGHRGLQQTDGIRIRRLRDLAFSPVVRRGHPLTGDRKISLAALMAFPMAAPEDVPQHVPLYRELTDASPPNTRVPQIACADFEILCRIVRTTDAFMTAVEGDFAEQIAAGELVRLVVPSFRMVFRTAVIDRKDHYHPAAVERFITELNDHFLRPPRHRGVE
jgi:DNA-binding transcriptional LysR family regulator